MHDFNVGLSLLKTIELGIGHSHFALVIAHNELLSFVLRVPGVVLSKHDFSQAGNGFPLQDKVIVLNHEFNILGLFWGNKSSISNFFELWGFYDSIDLGSCCAFFPNENSKIVFSLLFEKALLLK